MHVAPSGMGDGTLNNPMSLNAALSRTEPASLLFMLRGGVYSGSFIVTHADREFRSYPGEKVKIDGSFTVNAPNCIFDGLEIYSSKWTTRQSAVGGSESPDPTIKDGFVVNRDNVTIRNCIIHDTVQGIRNNNNGLIVEDCHFYNNGWQGSDRGHGHGLYTTNIGTPSRIARNVFGPSYSDWGIHGYSEVGMPQSDMLIQDNVHIGKIALLFTSGAMDNVTIIGNETWRGQLAVARANVDHRGMVVQDNYLVGAGPWYALIARRLKDCDVSGNTVIATDGNLMSYVTPNTDAPIAQVWGANAYHGQGVFDQTLTRTWEAWRTMYGLDSDSARVDSAPVFNRIRVINNQIVVIYNWQQLTSVIAPIAGTYRNCQNPAELITLNAGDQLPMDIWTVATPIAGVAPLVTFDSRFAVFLVEPL